jgi:hypothetical protein
MGEGYLRMIERDGQPVKQLRCPHCGLWADVDDDQARGVVSVICPQCRHHDQRDWRKAT